MIDEFEAGRLSLLNDLQYHLKRMYKDEVSLEAFLEAIEFDRVDEL